MQGCCEARGVEPAPGINAPEPAHSHIISRCCWTPEAGPNSPGEPLTAPLQCCSTLCCSRKGVGHGSVGPCSMVAPGAPSSWQLALCSGATAAARHSICLCTAPACPADRHSMRVGTSAATATAWRRLRVYTASITAAAANVEHVSSLVSQAAAIPGLPALLLGLAMKLLPLKAPQTLQAAPRLLSLCPDRCSRCHRGGQPLPLAPLCAGRQGVCEGAAAALCQLGCTCTSVGRSE